MSESFAAALANYQERERVPLREVGELVGMDRAARSYAVKAGVIRPAGRAGLGGGYVVDADEAARILFAAALAIAAGIAIVTALRGIKGAGFPAEALAAALPK